MLAIRRAYPRLSGAAGARPFLLALPGWLIGFVPEHDDTAAKGSAAVYYNPERTRQWASLPTGGMASSVTVSMQDAAPFGLLPRCL